MTSYTLLLLPNLSELEKLFNWLENIPASELITSSGLALVCEEVFCNIVNHAYSGNPDPQNRQVQLSLALSNDYLRLEFIDQGIALPRLPSGKTDLETGLEDRPIGGLGWTFIRHYMDEIAYRREQGKNILTLSKRVKGDTNGD